MKSTFFKRSLATTFAGLAIFLSAAATASAATEPLWNFVPRPPFSPFQPTQPPPTGRLSGPCGAGVDSSGNFYISDYYHNAVVIWQPESAFVKYAYGDGQTPPLGSTGYITQIPKIDPVDGPCGLALDGKNYVYVNDFHRKVVKYGPLFSFGSGTIVAGQGVDATHPTGVSTDPATDNVYIDSRTYISVYDKNGVAVPDGLQPLKIGVGSLLDGYGVAFSTYPGTAGRLYVPDAGTNTVKIYDPAVDKVNPVAEIDGSATPPGKFISLRDASIAVDRVSGDVYVADNLQPRYTERPESIIYVFDAAGAYQGHLIKKVTNPRPVGLAVDNSSSATYPAGTQGLVYVTSGNTEPGSIYNYTPDAATTAEPSPASFTLAVKVAGAGQVTMQSAAGEKSCSSDCQEQVPAGSEATVEAAPRPGSEFVGWSGSCEGSASTCTVQLDGGASITARFESERAGPTGESPAGSSTTSGVAPAGEATDEAPVRQRARRKKHGRRAGHNRGKRRHRHGARSTRSDRDSGGLR